jgi:hypothetical protein
MNQHSLFTLKVFLYQLKRREYWNKPFTDCSITILKYLSSSFLSFLMIVTLTQEMGLDVFQIY